jgi:hypothetical protein
MRPLENTKDRTRFCATEENAFYDSLGGMTEN